MDFPKPDITKHLSGFENKEALFSILIPSWNNLPYLSLCIDSIRKNSYYQHQIIVHVNEGNDGTIDWVKEQGLDYTFSFTNAGVCYAMNSMAELAYTKYLLYINDDMYVCLNWDKSLWAQKEALGHDKFFLSSTLIEPLNTKNNAVIAPHNFGLTPETFDEKGLTEFVSTLVHYNWSGSAWPPNLVSKKLFIKVGGYSQAFSPGFGSDPDFAMKLWQADVRDFIGIGNSFVYHFLSKSTARIKPNNGRKQFAQKWGFPSSHFYKHVLQMGKPITVKTKLKFEKSFRYLIARLKGLYISIK